MSLFSNRQKPTTCLLCGEAKPRQVSSALGVCLDCLRRHPEEALPIIIKVHGKVRAPWGLPPKPPKTHGGIPCNLCSNECLIGPGEVGYCGLRQNIGGRLVSKVKTDAALLHYYLDPHVTNCCSAYFCPAGTGAGFPKFAYRPGPEIGYYNLAIFFYACNFDCLFCQNASHKALGEAPLVTAEEIVRATVLNERISCWCFFGGSPEPQLPFALKASEKVLEALKGKRILRICFEWNGCGNQSLVERAAQLALESGGNLKFDLKAFTPSLSIALSGVPNSRAFENFRMVYERFYKKRQDLPVLTATTLLVPGYVDALEIDGIARFIASLDRKIPYSLLVFHPNFAMRDLPITPIEQVRECLQAAERHLDHVHVGNLHLLGFASMEKLKSI
ncbi:radical SAM protein [Candidatus Bathyarchaeota archaeon]|nr:radical SAM protein [Candidatus Bathyarchaeota archaeon]MBS7627523.1 radical SAM protein [Candidatus Bathyarchaeota archaeon]